MRWETVSQSPGEPDMSARRYSSGGTSHRHRGQDALFGWVGGGSETQSWVLRSGWESVREDVGKTGMCNAGK